MRKSIHTTEYVAMCWQLRELRAAAGLSQRSLAARLKVPPSWVAKVETGERRVDVVEFVRIVAACEADVAAALMRVAEHVSPQFGRGRRGRRS